MKAQKITEVDRRFMETFGLDPRNPKHVEEYFSGDDDQEYDNQPFYGEEEPEPAPARQNRQPAASDNRNDIETTRRRVMARYGYDPDSFYDRQEYRQAGGDDYFFDDEDLQPKRTTRPAQPELSKFDRYLMERNGLNPDNAADVKRWQKADSFKS